LIGFGFEFDSEFEGANSLRRLQRVPVLPSLQWNELFAAPPKLFRSSNL
jgi:hypothetical protein